jgi:hypothetical protein
MKIIMFGKEILNIEKAGVKTEAINYNSCIFGQPYPIILKQPTQEEQKSTMKLDEVVSYVSKRTGLLEEWVERILASAAEYANKGNTER